MNKKLERELRDADNLFPISDKSKFSGSKSVVGIDIPDFDNKVTIIDGDLSNKSSELGESNKSKLIGVKTINVRSCCECIFHSCDDDGCNSFCSFPGLNNRKTPFEFDFVNNCECNRSSLPGDCPLRLKKAIICGVVS